MLLVNSPSSCHGSKDLFQRLHRVAQAQAVVISVVQLKPEKASLPPPKSKAFSYSYSLSHFCFN